MVKTRQTEALPYINVPTTQVEKTEGLYRVPSLSFWFHIIAVQSHLFFFCHKVFIPRLPPQVSQIDVKSHSFWISLGTETSTHSNVIAVMMYLLC